jgi:hypothetical protein
VQPLTGGEWFPCGVFPVPRRGFPARGGLHDLGPSRPYRDRGEGWDQLRLRWGGLFVAPHQEMEYDWSLRAVCHGGCRHNGGAGPRDGHERSTCECPRGLLLGPLVTGSCVYCSSKIGSSTKWRMNPIDIGACTVTCGWTRIPTRRSADMSGFSSLIRSSSATPRREFCCTTCPPTHGPEASTRCASPQPRAVACFLRVVIRTAMFWSGMSVRRPQEPPHFVRHSRPAEGTRGLRCCYCGQKYAHLGDLLRASRAVGCIVKRFSAVEVSFKRHLRMSAVD